MSVLANRREIYAVVMPHQTGAIPRVQWLYKIYANPSKAELRQQCHVKQESHHGPVASGRFMQNPSKAELQQR
jgi:hypothetical protein